MGVSDLVIGLTIVAAGTSMPEVATSVMAASRASATSRWATWSAATPSTSSAAWAVGWWPPRACRCRRLVLNFDLWVMLAVALACLPVFLTGREIARWEGGLFLGYYVAYTAYLILAAQQHDAAALLAGVMSF
jgi:cation:H+ antiporter